MVPSSLSHALSRRAHLRIEGDTNAIRLIDGSGDGGEFAGLVLEDYADRWLVQTDDQFVMEPPEWLREVRPPPRAIYWKRLEKSDRRPPVHWQGEIVAAPFEIREQGVVFLIDFAAGYSQGIFLDQRANRRRVRELARAGARSVLNLFAYTCAFSVVAAMEGTATTSVDLSKKYLDWGRANFRANQLDPATHEFHAGDVFDRLRLFAKKGRQFDLVIVDPPTFSRDRGGKVFRVERDYPRLAQQSAELVAPGGWLFCSTNHRGLPADDLLRIVKSALGAGWRFESADMPPDFNGEKYLQSVWSRRAD